jgi:prepilin-type N-terminal cleavage/methylation domain-containing protein
MRGAAIPVVTHAASLSSRRRRAAARGFTLIELLVCIGIALLILAILLPSLRKAREQARTVVCGSNLHQISAGFMLFAAEHDRQLPGGFWDNDDPSPEHHDWLMPRQDYTTAPQGGIIYKYLRGDPTVFRCPSLDQNLPRAGSFYGPFSGSNGRFDYAAMVAFSGAGLWAIKGTSRILRSNGQYDLVATPLIVEEEPIWINGFKLNGAHGGPSTLAHRHHGGSQYATITGAVTWYNEPTDEWDLQGCFLWECEGPSGDWKTLADEETRWGRWNRK